MLSTFLNTTKQYFQFFMFMNIIIEINIKYLLHSKQINKNVKKIYQSTVLIPRND